MIREIHDTAGVPFWMYSLKQFMFEANNLFSDKLNKKSVEEIKVLEKRAEELAEAKVAEFKRRVAEVQASVIDVAKAEAKRLVDPLLPAGAGFAANSVSELVLGISATSSVEAALKKVALASGGPPRKLSELASGVSATSSVEAALKARK